MRYGWTSAALLLTSAAAALAQSDVMGTIRDIQEREAQRQKLEGAFGAVFVLVIFLVIVAALYHGRKSKRA